MEAEPAIVSKGEGENTQVVLRGRKEGKAKALQAPNFQKKCLEDLGHVCVVEQSRKLHREGGRDRDGCGISSHFAKKDEASANTGGAGADGGRKPKRS